MATTTGTGLWYDKALKNLQNGAIDIDTDALQVLLTTSTYTPDAANHEFVSSITNELSGSGYSRQTLTSVTLTEPSAGTWRLDSADPVFTASGGSLTARYWVLFSNAEATDAARELIAYGLLDSTPAPADVVATDGNSITINVPATGWYNLAKA